MHTFIMCLCACLLAGCQPLEDLPMQTNPRKIKAGQTHTYQVNLEAGAILDLKVIQHGVDLSLAWAEQTYDGMTWVEGPEFVVYHASQKQTLQIDIVGSEIHGGHYRIEATVHPPGNPEMEKKAARYLKFLEIIGLEERAEKVLRFQNALDGEEHAPFIARMRLRLAWLQLGQNQFDAARANFEKVAQWSVAHHDEALAYAAHLALADITVASDPETGAEHLRKALAAAESMGSDFQQARIIFTQAIIAYRNGMFQESLAKYDEALKLIGDRYPDLRAKIQREHALTYVICGRTQRARDQLMKSHEWWKHSGNLKERLRTEIELAWSWRVDGQPEKALTGFQYILPLTEELEDEIKAGLYDRMGTVYRLLGQLEESDYYHNEALQRMQESGDIHANLATLYLETNEPNKALKHAQKAAHTFKAQGKQLLLANALFQQSRALQLRGEPHDHLMEEVVALIGNIHSETTSPTQAANFLHTYYPMLFEFTKVLLDKEHNSEQAFLFLESFRGANARSFMTDDAAQHKLLTDEIDTLAYTSEETSELRQKLDEKEALATATNADFPPLAFAEIRETLLQPDSVILSYCLGEREGFLWAISQEEVRVFPLPGFIELQKSIVRYLPWLKKSRYGKGADDLALELSRTLLKPAAAFIEDKHLMLIKDGPLHSLPFAQLPDPNQEDQPLIAGHQIVVLGSATRAVLARQWAANRHQPDFPALVFADPVYDQNDERLAYAEKGLHNEVRLRATAQEASFIAGLRPQSQILMGFDANRETFLNQNMAQYQVVHLGVHGESDKMSPQLNRLILSLYSPEGEPLDGYLRAHHLDDLDMPVELVVLSACETAVGQSFQGEGLWSLVRDFREAGALRVMASLWSVGDKATAELMSHFYHALWELDQSPAQALQTAQNQMRLSGKHHPANWTGFELHGDLFPFAHKFSKN